MSEHFPEHLVFGLCFSFTARHVTKQNNWQNDWFLVL